MKTCSRCGHSYPDAQFVHRLQPAFAQGRGGGFEDGAHIDYLLSELPQWVMAGWMDPTQARQLATNTSGGATRS